MTSGFRRRLLLAATVAAGVAGLGAQWSPASTTAAGGVLFVAVNTGTGAFLVAYVLIVAGRLVQSVSAQRMPPDRSLVARRRG